MKKIFTLAACAALCTGSMWADIKIGDTSYEKMSDAVAAVTADQVITVSGTVTIDKRLRNDNAVVTIKGEPGAVINYAASLSVPFVVAKQGLVISDVTLEVDGEGNPSTALFEFGGGTSSLTNVTFNNISTTAANGIIQIKGSGKVTLDNCTFSNCSGVDNVGLCKMGGNKALTLSGDINGFSLMIEKNNHAIVASDLAEATPAIKIYALAATDGNVLVSGTTDLSKFDIVCAEGLKAVAGDADIECRDASYTPDYLATIGETGYMSWQGAWDAATVTQEPNAIETITVNVLKDVEITARYINANKNSNAAFEGAGEGVKFTYTNGNKTQTMFESNSGATTKFTNITFESADERTQNALSSQGMLILDNCDLSTYSTTQNHLFVKDNGSATLTASNLPRVALGKKGHLNLGAGCEIETINIEINEAGVYPCLFVGDAFNAVDLTFGDVTDMTAVLGKTLISGTTDATKFTLPEGLEYELVANEANDGLMFSDNQSGVESVMVEDADAPVEWFNLQGVRVANPDNGVYIRRQGNKVEKVVL